MAYATVADMMLRYDPQLIRDLATNDGECTLTDAEVQSNDVALAILDDASGAIDAALSYGGRYLPANLAGLSKPQIDHLKRITCEIAFAYIMIRKGSGNASQIKEYRNMAEQSLERLRKGTHIFTVPNGTESSEPHVISGGLELLNPYTSGTFTKTVDHYYPVTRRYPYYGN